ASRVSHEVASPARPRREPHCAARVVLPKPPAALTTQARHRRPRCRSPSSARSRSRATHWPVSVGARSLVTIRTAAAIFARVILLQGGWTCPACEPQLTEVPSDGLELGREPD